MKKFFTFLSIFLTIFIFASLLGANANSAVRRYRTPSSFGIYNNNDNSIKVLKEDLTFDLSELDNNVTAEYTLCNASWEKIEAELVFPIGYIFNQNNSLIQRYEPSVYLNSNKIEAKKRIILNANALLVESILDMSDTPIESMLDEYKIYHYIMDSFSPDTNVIITNGYIVSDIKKRYTLNENSSKVNKEFYVLAKADYSVEVSGNKTYTFEESDKFSLIKNFICDHKDLYTEYNDIDIYNLYVSKFEKFYDINDALSAVSYNISLNIQETCTNKVSTNFYPYRNDKYKSPVYEMTYYLSPASTFQSFKNLNITVNTNLNILKSSVDFVKAGDNKYTFSSESLLKDELFIATCKDNIDGYDLNISNIIFTIIGFIFAALVIISIALAILTLIFSKKFKKFNNNWLLFIQTILLIISLHISTIIFLVNTYVAARIFLELALALALINGIMQIILYDRKIYNIKGIIMSIILEVVIFGALIFTSVNYSIYTNYFIIAPIYLYSLAYIFFKSNFLKDKENYFKDL